MGKMHMLMGKSSSGKDTIKNLLIRKFTPEEWEKFHLSEVHMHTTRPIRTGEINGKDYWFVDNVFLDKAEANNEIIEVRKYETIYGLWSYFTHVDSIDLKHNNYIYLNTLEAYNNLVKYFSSSEIIPYYIYVKDDGERLQRALDRERRQENPKYAELCRRYLADEVDFSLDKLNNIPNLRWYENDNLEECCDQIYQDIRKELLKDLKRK